jgi:hypothetical protein
MRAVTLLLRLLLLHFSDTGEYNATHAPVIIAANNIFVLCYCGTGRNFSSYD